MQTFPFWEWFSVWPGYLFSLEFKAVVKGESSGRRRKQEVISRETCKICRIIRRFDPSISMYLTACVIGYFMLQRQLLKAVLITVWMIRAHYGCSPLVDLSTYRLIISLSWLSYWLPWELWFGLITSFYWFYRFIW